MSRLALVAALALLGARIGPDAADALHLHIVSEDHEHSEVGHQHGDADDHHEDGNPDCHHEAHCCCSHAPAMSLADAFEPMNDGPGGVASRLPQTSRNTIQITSIFHVPLA